jgi:hypothetical protein
MSVFNYLEATKTNHPIIQYFKCEYKTDWEFEYYKFIEKKKNTRYKNVLSLIKNKINSVFSSNLNLPEGRLSN